MQPENIYGAFDRGTWKKCRQFAVDSLDSSADEYARRGQEDPGRKIIQTTNGKLVELQAFSAYQPRFSDLTPPDFEIYQKKDKSWTPDLISKLYDIRIAVKAKFDEDAERWGPSWIFEKTDRKIFGSKLDAKNLDPHQYVCMGIVDPICREVWLKACVKLQWLHDNNLFTKPDRDYLGTKLTVRLENMEKVISNPDELWQL